MSAAAKGRRRLKLPVDLLRQLHHEAGYRCAVPSCRAMLVVEVHHILALADDGPDDAHNLIALCRNCHGHVHNGVYSIASVRTWKQLLVSLNEAYDRRAVDLLLFLDQHATIVLSGDGLLRVAGLASSGFVTVLARTSVNASIMVASYTVELSPSGRLFIDAWKQGDMAMAMSNSSVGNAIAERPRNQRRKRAGG